MFTESQRQSVAEVPRPKAERKLNYVASAASFPGHENFKQKTNQDRYVIQKMQIREVECGLFCVMDGHGPQGHLVSGFLQRRLPEIFQKILQDRETVNTKLSKGLERLFEYLEREVGESLEFDATMSGSTCVLIFIILNRVYCANIGDSRAVFGFQSRDRLEIKDLSRDHKPELPSEMDRIRRHGGAVESMRFGTLQEAVGPLRVWKVGAQPPLPGLSMSRSLGDVFAKTCGVIATPEVCKDKIDASAKFLFLASDGVWEVLSSQEVSNLIQKFLTSKNPSDAVKAITDEATKRWTTKHPNYTDDITAIVIFFQHRDATQS